MGCEHIIMVNFIEISLGNPASMNGTEEEGGIFTRNICYSLPLYCSSQLKLNSSGIYESNPDNPIHFL
jgi:hypothetical protein